MTHDEVAEALERYVAQRELMEAGEAPYSSIAELFTEDAIFVDIAHGRIEGRDNIRRLFVETTDSLGFTFPMDAWAHSGDWAFVKWRQVVPGTRPDGSPYQQSGISTLRYGGDGLWRYQEDLMNMAHVMEDLGASGWTPAPDYPMPPAVVDRNFSDLPSGVTLGSER